MTTQLIKEFYTGDTFARTFTQKVNGAAIAVTGFTYKLDIKKAAGQPDIFSKEFIDTADHANGQVLIKLLPEETVSIQPGTYVFFLRFTDLAGNVKTLNTGTFNVLQGAD